MTSGPDNAVRIAGIDPGLATGGLVLLELTSAGERVLAARTMGEARSLSAAATTKAMVIAQPLGGWSDLTFLAADLRSQKWLERFLDAWQELEAQFGSIHYAAVESFVDQPQRAGKLVRLRWTTPLLIGRLACQLEQLGLSARDGRLVWQDAGVVLRQQADELGRLAHRTDRSQDILLPGDHLVTNSHQRAALAHARALALRLSHPPTTAQAALCS